MREIYVPYDMSAPRGALPLFTFMLACVPVPSQGVAQLPATAPTQNPNAAAVAPLYATEPAVEPSAGSVRSQSGSNAAQVSCAGGQLEIHAQNSSLNQILKAISRCTGMRVTGRVADQRVFGDYGPAAPATVLATLLDGTGTNMLLQETEADQPAQLILTARTGGATPPPPVPGNQDDESEPENPSPTAQPQDLYRQAGQPRPNLRQGLLPGGPGAGYGPGNQAQGSQPNGNSAVTGLPSIPQPINNVNGSPNNTSPTAATYPTTNSVPLDSLATPSTTPSSSGIVDAPNPPPAGSDTATAMSGSPQGLPGNTTIVPPASQTTATPSTSTDANSTNQLTPEQVFQQLQERVHQQEQQQDPLPPQ